MIASMSKIIRQKGERIYLDLYSRNIPEAMVVELKINSLKLQYVSCIPLSEVTTFSPS